MSGLQPSGARTEIMPFVKSELEEALAQNIALTFDDVRVDTGYSEILPSEVNLESRFSRNVGLRAPLVSAAMDTVTEHEMAIEIAKQGGIGVLHKYLGHERQLSEFYKVKFHLHALITKPITVRSNMRISDVLEMRRREGYGFNTFPVVDEEERFVGIVTGNDFELCGESSQTIKDIMTSNPVTGGIGLTIEGAYKLMIEEKKKVLPLVDDSGILAGMYVWSDVQRVMSGKSDKYNLDKDKRLMVGIAVGVDGSVPESLDDFVRQGLDVVVIDSAHGYSKKVIDTLRAIKRRHPSLDVVAGNISTEDAALDLAKAGADGIKVGQGGGSICTTRVVAGIGCPQITAVYRCAKALSRAGYDIPICSDGGVRYSGDVVLAIGAGAHSVMLGNVLAGADETPGEVIQHKGRQYKVYRGMGSEGAMKESAAARERYGQDGNQVKFVPEGVEGLVPYKGKVEKIIFQFVGGLRSGMGYVGAGTIEELRKKSRFIRITQAGRAESHPHDVLITIEPPNYSVPVEDTERR